MSQLSYCLSFYKFHNVFPVYCASGGTNCHGGPAFYVHFLSST
jgi:hypothetical protein